jgi:hypothetical protein
MKKPPHGSDAVTEGQLRGATDRSDYFYFFCPHCPTERLLRILDYQFTRQEDGNPYNATCKREAARSFIIAFDITCEECGFHDCVKVSNLGWQGGTHSDALERPRPDQERSVL